MNKKWISLLKFTTVVGIIVLAATLVIPRYLEYSNKNTLNEGLTVSKEYIEASEVILKNELSDQVQKPEEIDIYLANDDDFEPIHHGDYWKYIGDKIEIELPTVIHGEIVTSCQEMFKETNVTKVVFTGDTITNTIDMFSGSKAILIDLSEFNTENVIDMRGMFDSCDAKEINLENLKTGNVTRMLSMFRNVNLDNLNLSGFNTDKVDEISYMFGQSSINHLDLTGFNTSKVTDMESLFTSGNFGNLNLSMFDTANVVNMAHMFYGTTLESLNISSFNTKSLTNMQNMFTRARIPEIDLSSFDMRTSINTESLFWETVVADVYAKTDKDAEILNNSSSRHITLKVKVKQ